MIAGTHIDKVKHFRIEKKKLYTDKIVEMYGCKSCYPTIKAIKFVCCDIDSKKYDKHKESIMELRDTLYDVASEMKLSLGTKSFAEHSYLYTSLYNSYIDNMIVLYCI